MAETDRPASAPRKARAARGAALPGTADPVEIAMGRIAASDDPDPARALLEAHRQLVGAQQGLARHELFRSRFRTVRDACIAVLFVGLLGLLIAAVVSASRSQAIVVAPFAVPPALAERGLTGEVVAQRMLDKLAEIQRKADSVRTPASFANSWSGDLKVQIPTTGLSLDDATRLLRRSLGDETHVSGEVIADGATMRVVVRSGIQLPAEASGTADELDTTLQRAAEQFFGRQQPYLHAIYLSSEGRDEESLALAAQLARSGPAMERAWGYNALGNRLMQRGDFRAARRMFLKARQLAPTLAPPVFNMMNNEFLLGRDGRALDRQPAALASYRAAQRAGTLKPDALASILLVTDHFGASLRGDFDAAYRLIERTLEEVNYNNSLPAAPLRMATYLAALHRPREGAEMLAANPIAPDELNLQTTSTNLAQERDGALIAIAARRGDWRLVMAIAERPDRDSRPLEPIEIALRPVMSWPWIALAAAHLGDKERAARVIAATPLDCDFCLRTRGVVAALAGDRRSSDKWFAHSVRQSPQLAFGDYEWGRAKLRARDLPAAIARFDSAAKKAPRWADPLKGWGDALALQGKDREAVAKYAAAAERAPRWGALHFAWGAALWRTGERDDARQRLNDAATMDLSRGERERLGRALATARGAPNA
ncbi:hypothetical protein [Sphingomonas mesophila]|uniref:hypothetical protein n=1 Tax=Sphingomonas mesophila TaxID=2303576 RepID=UPI000E57CDE2|nr:hypothetical protein [Sphingomonas mesophila]